MIHKTLLISIILGILSSINAFAEGFHDELVNRLTNDRHVDKTVVVERYPVINKIKRASYNFTFPDRKEYIYLVTYIRNTLINNSKTAIRFSMGSGDDGKILLQIFERPNTIYSYGFSKNKNEYQLLISVSEQGEDAVSLWDKRDKNFDSFLKEINNFDNNFKDSDEKSLVFKKDVPFKLWVTPDYIHLAEKENGIWTSRNYTPLIPSNDNNMDKNEALKSIYIDKIKASNISSKEKSLILNDLKLLNDALSSYRKEATKLNKLALKWANEDNVKNARKLRSELIKLNDYLETKKADISQYMNKILAMEQKSGFDKSEASFNIFILPSIMEGFEITNETYCLLGTNNFSHLPEKRTSSIISRMVQYDEEKSGKEPIFVKITS